MNGEERGKPERKKHSRAIERRKLLANWAHRGNTTKNSATLSL